MLTILLLLAIAGYVISAVVILRNLLQNRELHSGFHIIPALVAIISHALLVFNEFSADNFHHINIASSLASVSWLVALFALLRSHHSGSLLLKPVVYLFAALTCLLLALAPAQWGSYINMNAGLLVHIVLSLVAYGVLALATLYAIQAAYVSYTLKQRRNPTLFHKLPPLMTIERYFFRLLFSGTILLILALLSGFAFLDNMFAQNVAHKTFLSIAAAIVYVVANVMHRVSGARGKVMVILTLVGSSLLTLGYFGSRFVKDIILT
ncbi:ABC transporter permease [Idiomarina sp. OT37-5b]|jgi:ABC-type uncharacterized transport system permease subunit|uniref:ABC transporter permease n=1 Tax=Idiomarina aquatica TaxID=1327752 RepID=A0AA94EEI8_9GAMM|nr:MULTISPECIES: cytochrome c biogenesis protein CcsA [Idiomarina]AVJ56355.1 ABC transporter permease [Idiomarina sp. OT37-5b]RUO43124.1 ABC transporter permease [Idiomarina aquatica]